MREKELRLALVCYGGISLAVYMHGVTKELWHLARASRSLGDGTPPPPGVPTAYHALLEAIAAASGTRMRVFSDIVAGASAGGINGVFLARAMVSGESLEPLTDLWLARADVDVLLDPDARPLSRLSKFWAVPIAWSLSRMRRGTIEATVERAAREEIRAKLSQFVRARWFAPPFGGRVFCGLLLDAFDAMQSGPKGPALIPIGQPMDLMVTVTDYAGHAEQMTLNSPAVVEETEHRLIFSFRHGGGGGQTQLDDSIGLVFAARATASFPGAFPPFTARELGAELASRNVAWSSADAFLSRQLPKQAAAATAQDTVLIDGSVLANAPFRPAIAALRERPARREVDRRFVYIDPKPGRRSVSLTGGGAGKGNPGLPGFLPTMLRAMSDIPREQPIRDNVDMIAGMTRRIRRMQHIITAMRPEVDDRIAAAFGRTLFINRPTAVRIAAWRATAQQSAAEDAGFGFVAYGHVKLSGVVEELARLFSDCAGVTEADRRNAMRADVWSAVRARGLDRMGNRRRNSDTAVVSFFRDHDVGFRIRRLRHMARRLDELAGAGGDEQQPSLEAMRGAIFTALAPYLDRESTAFYAALEGQDERASAFIDAVAQARDLSALDAATDVLIADALAGVAAQDRRQLLYAYLGFPYLDIATLPLLQGEGHDEFDPIKIDRISPDDARALSSGGTEETLKGIQFNSFGAFFSRAFRENDYLWGRLHAVERLFDIVISAMPTGSVLPAGERERLLREAFLAVLQEEAPRLPRVAPLVEQLQQRASAL